MTSRAAERRACIVPRGCPAVLATWLSVLVFAVAPPLARGADDLSSHVSPYIAMHSDDPVRWRLWDRSVIEEARASGKLMFVTSGYFSCYWCHVMQAQSFRDREVAEVLNSHYLPVVVDRELEPALDDHLVEFVAATRGAAGWPLNVIITPEGYPLIGITYLPRERFLHFLSALHPKWVAERAELSALAVSLSARTNEVRTSTAPAVPAASLRLALISSALANADEIDGGFGEQSKFPTTPQLMALLALHASEPREPLAQFLSVTLEHMAARGLYDLVGDGFFRYTVDPGWHEPHFEKMLYDNAQLARLYLRAAQVLHDPRWLVVGTRTLDFLLREMRHAQGGFISSLSSVDAGGDEGAYYLWQDSDLVRVLGDAGAARARNTWRWVEPESAKVSGALPVRETLGAAAEPDELRAMRVKLLRERSASRQLPRDQKRLAAWNALTLSAFVEGARLRPSDYGAITRELYAAFVADFLREDRVVRTPSGVGSVTLADYAQSASALLDYSDVLGGDEHRRRAAALVDTAWQLFGDARGWRGQARPLLPGMPTRPVLVDATLPSASATLYRVVARLNAHSLGTRHAADTDRMLTSGNAAMNDAPFWHATQIVTLR